MTTAKKMAKAPVLSWAAPAEDVDTGVVDDDDVLPETADVENVLPPT
jgi:hypothetical protein